MTVRMQCLDESALIEYVYDEPGAENRDARSAHVASCLNCAEEVRALQATRDELRAWSPPEAVRGVSVVVPQPDVTVLRPARWWRQPLPAWAQVAAAVALFSAGAALGVMRGTVTPQLQAGTVAERTQTAEPVAVTNGAAPVSASDLAELEQRLRAEIVQSQPAPAGNAVAVASRQENEALLQQVRTMIGESERRQQQELTLRTAELVKDVDAQRRGDLARIERTFGQMEGTTGVQVEQQRQLLNYLMRVSQRQPQ